MVNDTIVNEIHQFRAQLLDQHHGDFAAYFAALLAKQQQHPERYASFMQPADIQPTPSQAKTKPRAP
jgi:hypothetical protein